MLYKYRSLDTFGKRMISEGEMYFAAPSTLNDPLDCAFFFDAILRAIDKNTDGNLSAALNEVAARIFDDRVTGKSEGVFRAIENRISQAGILSLSLTVTDPLMWSHYARGHTGISIGIDGQYFEELPESEFQRNQLIGSFGVSYEATPRFDKVITKYIENELCGRRPIDIDHLFVDVLAPVLTTKSLDWKYEREVRVVRHVVGPVSIPKIAIKEVILGRETSPDDVGQVRSLLDSPSFSHVRLRRADFRENSFSIEINDA